VVLLATGARLADRFGARSLLVVAFFGGALRWMLLARVHSLPLILALQPLHAVSFGVWWVASVSYTRARAPAHALATAQGLFSAVCGAGSVAGMLLWGIVYRRAGGATTFDAACMVSLAAGVTAVLWGRRVRRDGIVECATAVGANG